MFRTLRRKLKEWLINWLFRTLLPCKEVTRLVSDSLDRKLSLVQRVQVKFHLLICIWCERYKKQLVFIRDALRHSAEGDDELGVASSSLSAEARQRLKRALANKNEPL